MPAGQIWDGRSWVVDPTYNPAAAGRGAAAGTSPALTGEIGASRGPSGGKTAKAPPGYIQVPGQPGSFYDPKSGGLWRGGSTYNPYGAGAQASGQFSPSTLAMVRGISDKAAVPINTQPTYNPNAPLPETVALKQMATIDPTGEAIRGTLGTGYNADLNSATAGHLPPGILREIQQDVRGNQVARGNYEGVAQAVQEGQTVGSAGLQYLNNVRNAALGYLGSGQSKLSASGQYVDRALNQQSAAMTGQMTPTYNPSSSGTPPAYSFIDPNAGAQFAQGTQNFMNQGVGAKPGSPDTSGQYIGAGIGALGSIGSAVGIGIASGAVAFCQVARAVYGATDPRFLKFRDWILFKAPGWLRTLYARHAHQVADWIQGRPIAKAVLRIFMNQMIRC